MPVRLTTCGLASSGAALIATDADSGAATLGLNVTPIWHDAPPASSEPHGVVAAVVTEKSATFVPLIIGVVNVSVDVPRFVTKIVRAFDFVTATVPNASVVAGASLTGVTPVPVNAIECGLVGS